MMDSVKYEKDKQSTIRIENSTSYVVLSGRILAGLVAMGGLIYHNQIMEVLGLGVLIYLSVLKLLSDIYVEQMYMLMARIESDNRNLVTENMLLQQRLHEEASRNAIQDIRGEGNKGIDANGVKGTSFAGRLIREYREGNL